MCTVKMTRVSWELEVTSQMSLRLVLTTEHSYAHVLSAGHMLRHLTRVLRQLEVTTTEPLGRIPIKEGDI